MAKHTKDCNDVDCYCEELYDKNNKAYDLKDDFFLKEKRLKFAIQMIL